MCETGNWTQSYFSVNRSSKSRTWDSLWRLVYWILDLLVLVQVCVCVYFLSPASHRLMFCCNCGVAPNLRSDSESDFSPSNSEDDDDAEEHETPKPKTPSKNTAATSAAALYKTPSKKGKKAEVSVPSRPLTFRWPWNVSLTFTWSLKYLCSSLNVFFRSWTSLSRIWWRNISRLTAALKCWRPTARSRSSRRPNWTGSVILSRRWGLWDLCEV